MTSLAASIIAAGASVTVGIISLVGVIISGNRQSDRIERRLEVSQAVTEQKLVILTNEVTRLGDVVAKLPVMEEQLKNVGNRVSDIENVMN